MTGLTTDHPNLFVKIADSGLFCLAGILERAFPNLANMNYPVTIDIRVSGYRAAQVSTIVQQGAVFPITLPDVLLVPNPVRVQGKVTDLDGNPISDARIIVVDEPNPAQPLAFHPLGLGAPLALDRPAGTPVHRRALMPIGQARQLTEPAPVGSRSIHLDSRAQLAVGDLLRIGPATAHEYRSIEDLPDLANPNQPGEVILVAPLNRSYPAATGVRRIQQNPIVVSTTLARDARAGDGVLLLDDPLADTTVQVGDPPLQAGDPPAEFHALGGLSDAGGDYRLDGVIGLRTIFLRATAAGFGPMIDPVAWTVDYNRPVNVVNLALA
jgi:hypothetical protein